MAFPSWPPPSGGAPVNTPELGPITNPFPYGSTQTANISLVNPAPLKNGTRYPQTGGTGNNGQNQGGSYQLPKSTKPMEVGPIPASPTISAISPAPIMGPGPQGTTPFQAPQGYRLEALNHAGNPQPTQSFPAGHYIDGLGTVITPTGVTRVIGGLGN